MKAMPGTPEITSSRHCTFLVIPKSKEARAATPQRQASTLSLVQLLAGPAHTGTAQDAFQLHGCDLVNVFEREGKKTLAF